MRVTVKNNGNPSIPMADMQHGSWGIVTEDSPYNQGDLVHRVVTSTAGTQYPFIFVNSQLHTRMDDAQGYRVIPVEVEEIIVRKL